ncbi:23S rRNA (uracil(1939)-C(5))-methyltransferase RlmD [Candidatus Protochlamydia amoebophila]|uniref:Putative RNA methyltransferase pc1544 n=1 Tax=Candidatus Protochlamydia amoebophila TaxID=362787 RepID=A0A0C1GZH1_9BACT|nr:23S rRNA (uracil(1939)-C(5))-methyltransferase RlmD [Candidatus Protochlamydia amoebophila]KIC70974.1 putative RNA methyltransferase pc1544 [Candidatus Protochlamydia amoebophila]
MKQRSIDVQIKEFSTDGHGMGSTLLLSNQKEIQVEVPFTIPGDQVNAILYKKTKDKYLSRSPKVTMPSNNRIDALCMHFGSCGGCCWQQLPYELQLKQKEKSIQDLFKPYLNENVKWHSIIPSSPWHYRNKMELTFSSDKAGRRYLGLIMQGTRGHVFQMKECLLANGWFAQAARAIQKWWDNSDVQAYHAIKDRGSLRTLTLREGLRTGDRLVMLTVSGNPDYALTKSQLQSFVQVLRDSIELSNSDQKLSVFLRIQQIAKGRPTNFYEMLLYGPDHIREKLYLPDFNEAIQTLNFRISPSAFFQPNTEQAEKLYSQALKLADLSASHVVYDLYCGTGTLGICSAKYVKEVIGIELSRESVLDARENVKENGLSNVTIKSGDVGQVLEALSQENSLKPDVVMVDPPRIGLDAKAIKHILDLKAPKLVYISCNPKTQVMNLGPLIDGGYQLQIVQPVDQFPQTVHVENITLLTLP